MYIKDFDKWNNVKKVLNKKSIVFGFHEKEIWWASFGVNVGNEQDGNSSNFERPVLIIKKFSNTTFLCAPLSTKKKIERFQSEVIHNDITGYALLDQIKVIDIKRLLRKIGVIRKEELDVIKNKLKELI